MAVSDYAIPWSPPDLTPGLSLLARSLQARRANKRADENMKIQRLHADINLRRLDAESARQMAEHNSRLNEQQAKRDMDQAAFMERLPYLAGRNPLAPAIAAKYGIGLEEQSGDTSTTAPTPTGAQGQTLDPLLATQMQQEPQALAYPDAGVDDAISGGGGPEAQTHTTISPMTPSGFEGGGLDALTDEHRRIMAENVTSVGDRTTLPSEPTPGRMVKLTEADVPPFTAAELASDAAPVAPPATMQPTAAQPAPAPPRNKLFRATIGGQSYDITPRSQETGLGPQYDALYQRYLQEPGGEKVALDKVINVWKADEAHKASADRTADIIHSREGARAEEENYKRWYAENFVPNVDMRDMWNKRMAASRVAAAATEKPSAADSAETRAITAFNADFKDFRDRTAFAQNEVRATRQVNEIKNLAMSDNPVNQALAVEQIGKIAHGGNTVTKATQDLIYHHMGGAFERGEAAIRQYTDHGRMAPSQLKMLRDTARDLAHHHDENKKVIQEGFEIKFGPNSVYGSPYMQPYARQSLDALYSQMGIAPAQVSAPQTEGSVRLGRRRGERTGAPGAFGGAEAAPGVPNGSTLIPGKLGPNGRAVWRARDGKLHEQDK